MPGGRAPRGQIEDVGAEFGRHRETGGRLSGSSKAKPRDFFDLGDGRGTFLVGGMGKARVRRARRIESPVVEAGADDERKSEALAVGPVERVWNSANSSGSSRSRPALACSLAEAGVNCPACASRPARSGWARISASLALRAARRYRRAEFGVQVARVAERPPVERLLRHPGRVLEQVRPARRRRPRGRRGSDRSSACPRSRKQFVGRAARGIRRTRSLAHHPHEQVDGRRKMAPVVALGAVLGPDPRQLLGEAARGRARA